MQSPQYSKERGLLGKLCVGEKKLEGKTFYLDNVKKRSTTLLLEAISLLGGVSIHERGIKVNPTGNKCNSCGCDWYKFSVGNACENYTKMLKFQLGCVKLSLIIMWTKSFSRNRFINLFFLLKRIESFLHKDVNFVVTGSQDVLKEETCSVVTKGETKGTTEGTQEPKRKQESGPRNDKQRPGTPRPMVLRH